MNEKTRLLALFTKVAKATNEFKDDREEILKSDMLSTKGKDKEIAEYRRQFAEAMEMFRDEMIGIVDSREKDYTAYRIKEAQERMRSSDYQAALTANLDALERGYMGRIEVAALLALYNSDDLATDRIHEVMYRTKNPYCDQIEKRITIKMQLNAFESIRRVIQSTVNVRLAEKFRPQQSPAVSSGLKPGKFSSEDIYFGSGYYAIKNELEEDLTINSPDASLGLQNNADKDVMHHSGNVFDIKAVKKEVETKNQKK